MIQVIYSQTFLPSCIHSWKKGCKSIIRINKPGEKTIDLSLIVLKLNGFVISFHSIAKKCLKWHHIFKNKESVYFLLNATEIDSVTTENQDLLIEKLTSTILHSLKK